MSDKTWKAVERAIAKRLSGQRVGCTGLATPDVTTDKLSVEIKTRQALPGWLRGAMAQSKRNSNGKLAIVVLHQVGHRHDDDIVAMRLSDFEQWIGNE